MKDPDKVDASWVETYGSGKKSQNFNKFEQKIHLVVSDNSLARSTYGQDHKRKTVL